MVKSDPKTEKLLKDFIYFQITIRNQVFSHQLHFPPVSTSPHEHPYPLINRRKAKETVSGGKESLHSILSLHGSEEACPEKKGVNLSDSFVSMLTKGFQANILVVFPRKALWTECF